VDGSKNEPDGDGSENGGIVEVFPTVGSIVGPPVLCSRVGGEEGGLVSVHDG
jgi:hypothetical protein